MKHIDGKQVPLEQLTVLRDEEAIKKVYISNVITKVSAGQKLVGVE